MGNEKKKLADARAAHRAADATAHDVQDAAHATAATARKVARTALRTNSYGAEKTKKKLADIHTEYHCAIATANRVHDDTLLSNVHAFWAVENALKAEIKKAKTKVAESWERMATDGLCLLYGLRDGQHTLNDVIECMESRQKQCRELKFAAQFAEKGNES